MAAGINPEHIEDGALSEFCAKHRVVFCWLCLKKDG